MAVSVRRSYSAMRRRVVEALLALLAVNVAAGARVDNATCALGGRCLPTFQCPDTMMQSRSSLVAACFLPSGSRGVLCPPREFHISQGAASRSETQRALASPQVRRAVVSAERQLVQLLEAAERTPVLVRDDGPSFGHFHSVLGPTAEASRADTGASHDDEEPRIALRSVLAAQELTSRKNASSGSGARDESVDSTFEDAEDHQEPMCPVQPVCDPAVQHYRRHDGTCNSLLHPRWGATNTPHSRLLPPRYHDGVWEPRRSVRGGPLPGPRQLSTRVCPDRDAPHHYASLLVMLFGQVVSHDILLTPSIQRANGSGVQCCERGDVGVLPSDRRHFACMPIVIPEDDPFFAKFGKRCINFARTQLGLRDDCQLAPAVQLNTVTHVVDASVVYGSTDKVAANVRAFRGGRLRTHREGFREHPPLTDDRPTCGAVSTPQSCFLTGDIRGNQMVGLIVVARLLVRQHNALADALSAVNPHWDDERLYQETRRIVAAQLQHVLYNEFLPVVIGHVAMADYELWPLAQGYSYDYDQTVNPSTTVEFATAAYRFGHSAVEGIIKLFHKGWGIERVFLPDITLDSSRMHHPSFSDEFLKSITRNPMQNVDPFVTQALTNYLFNGDKPFGVDLIAINIQRGRDHGMPTYDDVRVLQGLPSAHSFHDFGDLIPPEGVRMLQNMYESPQDVDLYVGGLLELPAHGAVVGHTFQGIIADQFSRLKKGDRFYYEYGGLPNAFTVAQLQEIRKTRMARLLCDINDNLALHEVSPYPFLIPTVPGNELVSCFHLKYPRIDLMQWKDW